MLSADNNSYELFVNYLVQLARCLEYDKLVYINIRMKYVFLTLSVLLLQLASHAQHDTARQVIGKVYTKSGGPYSTTVIFHRNKQAIAVFVTGGDSLQQIFEWAEEYRKKLGAGVAVHYERITYHRPGSKTVELNADKYNQNLRDEAEIERNRTRQEIDNLKNFDFISGNIYFSGYGFTNVTAVKAVEKTKLDMYYYRSGPGTTITLESCMYKNGDGSISRPISKSIKL